MGFFFFFFFPKQKWKNTHVRVDVATDLLQIVRSNLRSQERSKGQIGKKSVFGFHS